MKINVTKGRSLWDTGVLNGGGFLRCPPPPVFQPQAQFLGCKGEINGQEKNGR